MKLTANLVGVKNFDSRPITATDPGYDDDVWCTIRGIKVKPGDYICVAWKGRDYWTDPTDGKKHSSQRVMMCGVYFNQGIIKADTDKWRRIGYIGVDAGLAGFFQDKPNYADKEWFEFCDQINKQDYLITPEGFCTVSGYGDGTYPVYARKDESGDITALEIRF